VTLLAVALTMAATALALPGRLGMHAEAAPGGAVPRLLVLVTVGSLGVALWSWLDGHQFALATLAGLVVWGLGRLLGRRRAARAADRTADQVLAVCDAMASDLAAGQPPLVSLRRAAEEWPEFAPVAVAGQMGADVPRLLRELSLRPGARQLRTLAATWQVAHDTGSGLAAAIGQAAEAIRGDRRTARLVAAELAAAHATARMLAVLPVGVLLLGMGVGGDPVGFLTGSTAGVVCLAVGLGLSFAGLLWLERIADRVLGR
jgi:tight adherence protein B